jgi:hypothetical protein
MHRPINKIHRSGVRLRSLRVTKLAADQGSDARVSALGARAARSTSLVLDASGLALFIGAIDRPTYLTFFGEFSYRITH